jgi:hypothetical protein
MAFRTLFALAAYHDLEIDQMDVKTAFLNGQIIEDVYVEHPHGFGKSGEVCRLLKGLYGLKQSPRMWYKVIHDFLVSLGFQKL